MNILAVDTSSEVSGLALLTENDLFLRIAHAGRTHSREILPSIDGLLTEANLAVTDLDVLVFANGPGSFTGIRITVGVVQGLAYSLGIPVVPVSNLACLAQQAYRVRGTQRSLVAITARKDELFHGAYEVIDGVVQLIGAEGLHKASEFPPPTEAVWHGVGDGWVMKDDIERAMGMGVASVMMDLSPHPSDMLTLCRPRYAQTGGVDAGSAQPQYLREQVASPA